VRIFLTGGTGYIGGALCRRLVAEGHRVRALVRPTSRRGDLEALGVECVAGDILQPATLVEAAAGVDWVVHAAAELDMETPLERMRATNVAGSDHVAAAALAAGARMLALSSVAAFGGSPADGSPADEEGPVQHPLPTRYCVTKHEGERALDAYEGRGLALNVVYPSLVFGPPGKSRGTNVILRDLVRGRVPVMIGGDRWVSWVYLEDLVDGLVRVIERAPAGRRYLMTGEARQLADVVVHACRLAGSRPPRLRLPVGVVKALAPAVAGLYRLAGRRPPLTPQLVRSIERHWRFDDARARRELDWQPRGLDAALPPTVEFLLGLA
jgi:dihydroflavonol-4-reductase